MKGGFDPRLHAISSDISQVAQPIPGKLDVVVCEVSQTGCLRSDKEKMKTKAIAFIFLSLALLVAMFAGSAQASSSILSQLFAPQPLGYTFTYQGYLADGTSAASGVYDFQFRLYDALTVGSQVGSQLSVSDLSVSNGYFTAALDFGASAFNGNKLWLEIDVKPDLGSTYSTLTPRIELTATPHALFSLNADKLDSHDSAYFQREITQDCPTYQAIRRVNDDGTLVCESNLQRRVTGTCSSSQKITAIAVDGTVTCQPDIDTDTTYTNGFGLKLASNAFSVDTTLVQQRVSGSCRVGSTIQAVNADGTVICRNDAPLNRPAPPAQHAVSASFGGIIPGTVTQVTVAADGLPLVLFSSAGFYQVAHCSDSTCQAATITPVAPYAPGQDYASFTLDPAGQAVIVYLDSAATNTLFFARCVDITCSGVVVNPLAGGLPGTQNDITIAADGFPLVATWLPGPAQLWTVHCMDPNCIGGTPFPIDPPPGPPVQLQNPNPSITLGADGFGLIAYFYSPTLDLRVAHCNDVPCTAATFWTNVTLPPDGYQPSITTGADALGLVAYIAGETFPISLVTAHCSDGNCTTGSTSLIRNLSTPPPPSAHPSVTIGAFGLGAISFQDFIAGNNSVSIASCHNLSCSSASFSDWIIGTSISAITIAPSGNPLVGFSNIAGQLAVVQCSDWFCTPFYHRR
jgi:hypothetical protein